MAEGAYMIRRIAELHRMAAALYRITKRGGSLYRHTKALPTDLAAEHLTSAERAITSAKCYLHRATLAAIFARLRAEQLDYVAEDFFSSTSENAPLQKCFLTGETAAETGGKNI